VSGWRVLIGSRSFGRTFPEHLVTLERAGCEVLPNGRGRPYAAAELVELLPEVDAIVTGTDELTAEAIAAGPRLKTIAKHGVGLDNVDVEAARAHGVTVTSTPGTMHDAVADLAIALLLALAREIVPLHAATVAGEWAPRAGIELRDRTLGVVGLGRIGRAVARRAQAFGMRVCAADPEADLTWAGEHGVEVVGLDELLAVSDAVSLHAPGTGAPLLGREELARMRPGVLIVNTARGSLIDEEALVDALREGRVAGAGLDVFAEEPPGGSPLLALERVVATPHIGGLTDAALRRMGELCVRNCLAGLRGEL
jgi:phosphoglycerate dehydrogenase-like enzyme